MTPDPAHAVAAAHHAWAAAVASLGARAHPMFLVIGARGACPVAGDDIPALLAAVGTWAPGVARTVGELRAVALHGFGTEPAQGAPVPVTAAQCADGRTLGVWVGTAQSADLEPAPATLAALEHVARVVCAAWC